MLNIIRFECLISRSYKLKCQILIKYANNFFQKIENLGYMYNRYRIIDKLIFIKVFWKLSFFNILINIDFKLYLSFFEIFIITFILFIVNVSIN